MGEDESGMSIPLPVAKYSGTTTPGDTRMPNLITTCSRCSREWSPERRHYLAGEWRICPACRDGPKDSPPKTSDDKAPIDTQKEMT